MRFKRRFLNRIGIFREIWWLIKKRKKWWLAILILFFVFLGILIILIETAAIAPFIYTLF